MVLHLYAPLESVASLPTVENTLLHIRVKPAVTLRTLGQSAGPTMPMMAMSIGAHIASMVILNSVLNCTCLLRYWVLRGTVRIHPSRRATDWLYYIMVSIAFIQTCVMVYRLTQVKWVYDHVPPEEIPPKLLEKKLLVVRDQFSSVRPMQPFVFFPFVTAISLASPSLLPGPALALHAIF